MPLFLLGEKSQEDLERMGWQICGRGRKSGEKGGGVWIIGSSDIEMVPVVHESSDGSPAQKGGPAVPEHAEIAAAFIRPAGTSEWTALVGVYFTNSHKKKHFRVETLKGILATMKKMNCTGRKEGLKIRETLLMGDLNLQCTVNYWGRDANLNLASGRTPISGRKWTATMISLGRMLLH